MNAAGTILGLVVLATAAVFLALFGTPGEHSSSEEIPYEEPRPYICEMMRVASPEHDRGCVHERHARYLENSGWSVLDEYPDDFESRYKLQRIGSDVDWFTRWPEARPTNGGLEVELGMPVLPTVGQSADVVLDATSPQAASPVNATFHIRFIGDVEILSSDPPLKLNEFGTDFLIGQTFDTPRTAMLPGETHRFSVTVVPLSETPLEIWADGYGRHGQILTQSDAKIKASIGNQSSSRQTGEDPYTPSTDTRYVWTTLPHPQCWNTPWNREGQSVQDYYADRGIEIHDVMRLPIIGFTCGACSCLGGYIMFLTPEYDRHRIPPFA